MRLISNGKGIGGGAQFGRPEAGSRKVYLKNATGGGAATPLKNVGTVDR